LPGIMELFEKPNWNLIETLAWICIRDAERLRLHQKILSRNASFFTVENLRAFAKVDGTQIFVDRYQAQEELISALQKGTKEGTGVLGLKKWSG